MALVGPVSLKRTAIVSPDAFAVVGKSCLQRLQKLTPASAASGADSLSPSGFRSYPAVIVTPLM